MLYHGFLMVCSFFLKKISPVIFVCGNGTEVRGIVSIARPLNLRAVLHRTQKELGGFPVAAKPYFEKGLCLGGWLYQ